MVQGWIVGQNEVLVHRQAESFTDLGHDLSLLHGVNAQLPFEVLVQFNKVGGVAGVIDDDLNHGGNRVAVGHHCGRRGLRGRRGWHGCGSDRFKRGGGRGQNGTGFAFPRSGRLPRRPLNASVKTLVPVDVGHEFVVKHPHHHVVCTCTATSPRQQFCAVDALTLHRPSPHQGKRNL